MSGDPGDRPAVTVAIPTIDRPDFLRRAIASVLAQAGASVEVLVSDNASEAPASLVVDEFADDRVRCQRHSVRLGMTDNWNSCLEAATGEFFLLLSDDDALCPDGLRLLLHRLDARAVAADPASRPDVCYGRSIVVDPTDRLLWRTPGGPEEESSASFLSSLFGHNRAIYPCSTLFRTAALRAVGGYAGDRFGSSADLGAAVMVASRGGGIRFVDAEVCRYTEHGGNLTAQVDLAQWVAAIRAIAAAACDGEAVDPRPRGRLQRGAESFSAYFVMDVTLRRELRRGRGPIAAWRAADRMRASILPGRAPLARARALAKAGYVWLRQARAGASET